MRGRFQFFECTCLLVALSSVIELTHPVLGQESRRNASPPVRVQLDTVTRNYTNCVMNAAKQQLKQSGGQGAAAFARTRCEPVFLQVERTLMNLTKDHQFSRKEAEKIRSEVFITVGAALLTASASARKTSF